MPSERNIAGRREGNCKMAARELIQRGTGAAAPTRAVTGGGEVEDDAVERVVSHLKRVCRNTSLEFALHVGGVIIHYFYGGNTETWRARGPKATSFRRLAEHPELPMSPGALYRCVALFELCDRLDAPSRWRNLGASHLRTVLGLPSELQVQILTLANNDRWTVEALDSEVRKHKNLRRPRGGRKTQPVLVDGLSKLQQCIDKCCVGLECQNDYEPQHLQTSARAIAEAQEALDRLAELISRRMRASRQPPPLDEISDVASLPPAPGFQLAAACGK
jgi:hypothetical protein